MPAELGPGPNCVSTLTEQQDFGEIAAKACLGLITGTWVLVVRCHTLIVMLAGPRSNPPGWPAHVGQWRQRRTCDAAWAGQRNDAASGWATRMRRRSLREVMSSLVKTLPR